MRVEYIKTLSEAYLLDEPQNNIVPGDLFEHFYDLLKDMRENQTDLYTMFDSLNRFEQQKIFKEYFNLTFHPDRYFTDVEITDEAIDELESLEEFFLGGLETIFGNIFVQVGVALFAAYHRKPVAKAAYKTLNALSTVMNRVGKLLHQMGRSGRLSWAIVQQSSNECYRKAGFDPKDASFTDYFSQSSNALVRDVGGFFSSGEEDRKMDMLRDCYLYSIEEVIKLSASNYFTCLKNTGSLSKFPAERDYDMFVKVLSTSAIHESCEEFFKVLKEAFDRYDDILKLMYPYDDQGNKIRMRKVTLMGEIYNIQKSTSNNYVVKVHPQKQYTKN